MLNFLKTHISGFTTIIVGITAVVGATLAFESRYASAKEVEMMKRDNKLMYEGLRQDNRVAVDTLRKQQLEDKVFELNLKPGKTQVDEALLRRYNQQLKEVTDRINAVPSK